MNLWKNLLPIALSLLSFANPKLAALVPYILDAVTKAEDALGPGTGAAKKAFALEAIEDALNGAVAAGATIDVPAALLVASHAIDDIIWIVNRAHRR